MKRVSKSIAAVAAVVLLGFASSGWAAQITIDTAGTGYRSGSGGEFRVTGAGTEGVALVASSLPYYYVSGVAGTAWTSGFETFCIEFNEYISLPGTYAAGISGGAIYGGVAGGIDHDFNASTPTTDLISIGTAYLYSQFAAGTLAGYTYAPGAARAASALRLQQAIWYLEDEIALPSTNAFLTTVFRLFGTPGAGVGALAGGAKRDSHGAYGVAALNLGGPPPVKQDQLIMVPDGGLTLTLLGLGLGGLALLRRKLS